jgi:hypothetical protein
MEHDITLFVYKYWLCLLEEDEMEFIMLNVSIVEKLILSVFSFSVQ